MRPSRRHCFQLAVGPLINKLISYRGFADLYYCSITFLSPDLWRVLFSRSNKVYSIRFCCVRCVFWIGCRWFVIGLVNQGATVQFDRRHLTEAHLWRTSALLMSQDDWFSDSVIDARLVQFSWTAWHQSRIRVFVTYIFVSLYEAGIQYRLWRSIFAGSWKIKEITFSIERPASVDGQWFSEYIYIYTGARV